MQKVVRNLCSEGGVIYDPFMGSGTTAVACKEMNLHFIGSEISAKQCEWAKNRIENTQKNNIDGPLGQLSLF